MIGDVAAAIVCGGFGLAVVVYVVVDMVRFRRLQRDWKRQDAEFWEMLERWEPGIQARIRRRSEPE